MGVVKGGVFKRWRAVRGVQDMVGIIDSGLYRELCRKCTKEECSAAGDGGGLATRHVAACFST